MLFATLAFTSLIQVAEPSTVDSSQCMATVYELFNRESYAAAATEAKQCWASTADPNALFAAALSYQRLDRCSRTLLQLQRLSSLSSMAEMADFAKERITALREQCLEKTVEIRLHFTPSESGPEGILRAKLQGETEEKLVMALGQATGKAGTHTVHLDPGEWQLELERGDDLQTMVFLVDPRDKKPHEVQFPDPATEEVEPEIMRPPPLPIASVDNDRHRLRPHSILGYGASGAAAGLLLGGTTLVTIGSSEYKELPAQSDTSPNTSLNSILHTSQGFAAFGAAVGAGTVAITDFLGANERALIAESAVGGVLATGGLVGLVFVTQSYKKDGGTTPEKLTIYIKDHAPKDYATSALLGLGLGMAASAVISLVVTKLRTRKGKGQTHSTKATRPDFMNHTNTAHTTNNHNRTMIRF